MTVTLLRAKLHRIRVTEACLDYVGSLTVDADLMDAVGLYPHEKILCADVENGARFETYAIPGPRGSRVCCLNGAAAHMGKVGDRLIVRPPGEGRRPAHRDGLRAVHARGGVRPRAARRVPQ